VLILAFVFSCQKHEVNVPVNDESQNKMAQLESLGLVHLKSAVIIEYNQLCFGTEITTDVPKNSINDAALWDYYRFFGVEGDVVSINVVRVDCVMDPSFSLFFGTSATTEGITALSSSNPDLEFVDFRDDQVARPTACNGFCYAYGDPGPQVTLPHTGWYTLGVHDFLSCSEATGPFSYTLSISGIAPCEIVIDGCDTNMPNLWIDDAGAYMQELLDEIAAQEFVNHGGYVKVVAKLVESWYMAGLISLDAKDVIMTCAGQSSFGEKK
jgi:hypothetical protein